MMGKRNATIDFFQVRHVVHKHELTMTRTLSKALWLFEYINFCLSGRLANIVFSFLMCVSLLVCVHTLFLWVPLVQSVKQKNNFISKPKHVLWVLKRPASMKQFFWAPKTYVKNYIVYLDLCQKLLSLFMLLYLPKNLSKPFFFFVSGW